MSADDTEKARGLAVPPCPTCNYDGVHPVFVSGVDPIVHYWSCKACGYVWATRDDEESGSITADATPRKMA